VIAILFAVLMFVFMIAAPVFLIARQHYRAWKATLQ
jgi:preprotein translocase subunit YajC